MRHERKKSSSKLEILYLSHRRRHIAGRACLAAGTSVVSARGERERAAFSFEFVTKKEIERGRDRESSPNELYGSKQTTTIIIYQRVRVILALHNIYIYIYIMVGFSHTSFVL